MPIAWSSRDIIDDFGSCHYRMWGRRKVTSFAVSSTVISDAPMISTSAFFSPEIGEIRLLETSLKTGQRG